MLEKTELQKKFERLMLEGKQVGIWQWIEDNKLPIQVSVRDGESKVKTLNKMIAKLDQLVPLPTEHPLMDPLLEQLRFHVSNRQGLIKTKNQTLSRILSILRNKMMIPANATAEEAKKIAESIEDNMLKEHKEILANRWTNGKKFHELRSDVQQKFLIKYARRKEDGVYINDEFEFAIVNTYVMLLEQLKFIEKTLDSLLGKFPIWTYCLSNVVGISAISGGMILGHLDITRARTPGSFLRYCGITVEKDGRGTSKRKEHSVPAEYIDKDGKLSYKWSLGYNSKFRAWLLEVLVGNFIKKRKNGNPYAIIYDNKKAQLALRPDLGKKDPKTGDVLLKDGKHIVNDGHIHLMAKRHALKIFLIEFWLFWAALEGRPIKKPYYEEKINPACHAGKSHWLWMVEHLGDPLDLRYKLYGQKDDIPECYRTEVEEYLKENPNYGKTMQPA